MEFDFFCAKSRKNHRIFTIKLKRNLSGIKCACLSSACQLCSEAVLLHVSNFGTIGSALGLVGPVSVYCDWVIKTVWSVTSVSVWQHIKLCEQMHPTDTIACCCDIN